MIGAAIMIIAALTPFILTWWAPSGLNWAKLSDISQTYAAISIPLSGAALLGVAVSTSFQARQLRIENQERYRSAHRELLTMSLSDDQLTVCWEPPSAPISREKYRQHLFINMVISSWHAEYVTGRSGAAHIKFTAARVMRGELFREFWDLYGTVWAAEAETVGAGSIQFVDIMNEALRIAGSLGPPVSPGDYFSPNRG
ncbi:DUF6082 family protein [Streptomyces sp. NBC_00210]|uniref:DUF6082 family protein n=1 Tax=Streptomyces sp. NBC_00210 TaxID=2903636 RepID=UPI003251C844